MNDETLTLYYYNDGLTADERRRVERALCEEPELSLRYAKLCEELDALGNLQLRAPEAHVRQRWHDSIERAARSGQRGAAKSWPAFNFRSFAFGMLVAVALIAGVRIGVIVSDQSVAPPAVADRGDNTNSPPSSFARGIRTYLRDSQDFITDLPVDAATDRRLVVARSSGRCRGE
jgi:anti-sigma-K factor RskA